MMMQLKCVNLVHVSRVGAEHRASFHLDQGYVVMLNESETMVHIHHKDRPTAVSLIPIVQVKFAEPFLPPPPEPKRKAA